MNHKSIVLESLLEQLNHSFYNKNGSTVGSRSQGKILKILSKRGDMTQKDLQDILQIQPGSMSELVTKLEKKNLVIRTKDDSDNRRIILSITEEGLKHVEEYRASYARQVISALDVLTDEEKDQLEKLLLKLLDHERGVKNGNYENRNNEGK